MHITRTTRVAGAVLAVALAGGLAACGDDDDPAEGSSATTATGDGEGGGGSDLAAACDAEGRLGAAINAIEFPEGDEATEEEAQAARDHVAEEIEPLLVELEETAPDDVPGGLDDAIAALRDFGESADFAVLDDPANLAAFTEAQGYFFDECEGTKLEVTATEYAFEGLAATIAAGPARVRFTNGGEELHEMVAFTRADGETRTFAELLEAEDEDAVQFVGATFALQGEDGFASIDFEPGDYALVCFVPVGAVDPESEVEGPPHFTQGMVYEFTVE